MLSLNEIKVGKVLNLNNAPYAVTRTEHHKTGRGGAVLKVKLKNLIDGSMLDKTFLGSDKADEADTEKRKANFMYKDGQNAYLMDNASFEQFELPLDTIGDKIKFLKDGADIDVLYFDGHPVSIELPIKMKFKVTEAPPGVKGNTAGNVTKKVIIETGAEISAPLFINEGDEIMVNTDKEEYSERA